MYQSSHFFGSSYDAKGGPSFLCVLRKESERDTLKPKPGHRRIPKREESADRRRDLARERSILTICFLNLTRSLVLGHPYTQVL